MGNICERMHLFVGCWSFC